MSCFLSVLRDVQARSSFFVVAVSVSLPCCSLVLVSAHAPHSKSPAVSPKAWWGWFVPLSARFIKVGAPLVCGCVVLMLTLLLDNPLL